jgi:hypothetical protein
MDNKQGQQAKDNRQGQQAKKTAGKDNRIKRHHAIKDSK